MLTDEQIDKAYREVWSTVAHAKRLAAFARAIEAEVRKEIAAAVPYSGADENPPVFGRRWGLARDGFGLQRDDMNGNYVDIVDAISVLHQSQPRIVESAVLAEQEQCARLAKELVRFGYSNDPFDIGASIEQMILDRLQPVRISDAHKE